MVLKLWVGTPEGSQEKYDKTESCTRSCWVPTGTRPGGSDTVVDLGQDGVSETRAATIRFGSERLWKNVFREEQTLDVESN